MHDRLVRAIADCAWCNTNKGEMRKIRGHLGCIVVVESGKVDGVAAGKVD